MDDKLLPLSRRVDMPTAADAIKKMQQTEELVQGCSCEPDFGFDGFEAASLACEGFRT